ncbi:MAG: hypothetical protein JWN69_178 [Alphaproteobacteria bacterium]|nr:hypothetical protein [Alphaproteobacteria bacterium]
MLARRFLWIVTVAILLVLGAALAYRLFAPQLMGAAFVPSVRFSEESRSAPDYRRSDMWIARPELNPNPATWTPAGFAPTTAPRASVFFVHPTSYLDRAHWNAPLADPASQLRAQIFVRSQASAFNGIGAIWAPKYRQATIGAFLTDKPDADQALDLAYRDVRAAFDRFVAEAPAERPIILAGHSQGSFLLSRLLAERVAGTPLARRIAAAYLVGWPLSTTVDLPRLGLPACRSAGQAGCILAWQSFAEPADPKQVIAIYNGSAGPNGRPRAGTPILCVNPLTGNQGDAAPADANLGTLVPDASLTTAALRPHAVPARCDSRGLLLIGEDPVDMPPYILPGNNYHVFDYALFWTNIRADAERRLDAFARDRHAMIAR